MASGVMCQIKFGTMDGVKTWKFSDWDAETPTQKVKDLVQGMIANGSVYKYPPLRLDSAKLIETTESSYVID